MTESKTFDAILVMIQDVSGRLQELQREIRKLDHDINLLKAQLDQINGHDLILKGPQELKKLRVRDYLAGTGIGGVLITVIEWVRTHFF